MFYPPCRLIDRHKRSMLEGLIDGDFKLAFPNDPQSNPETLINILNNVLGEFKKKINSHLLSYKYGLYVWNEIFAFVY